jgi:sodium-dependent phosphate transporter
MFNGIYINPDQIWMIVVGFIIAFVLAFGIGANDVANSFGTSVGSKVLSLRQAFVLACIFETLGAVLLGAKVSDTIRKGIIDIAPYENNTSLLMVGNVAALAGSCVWLIAATLLRLPVSATHSIVGSTVGFALVAHGARGIHWYKLGMIIISWFISPVLAGGVSIALFFICKYFILNKPDPLEPGLRFLPIFYAATIVINLFSVFYDGPEMLGFDKIPLWGTFIISFCSGAICAIIIRVFVVPWQRRRIKADVYTVDLFVAENGLPYPVNGDVSDHFLQNCNASGIEDEKLEMTEGMIHRNGNGTCLSVEHKNAANVNHSAAHDIAHKKPKEKLKKKHVKKPRVTPNLSQTPLVDVESQSGYETPVRSPTGVDLDLMESTLHEASDERCPAEAANGNGVIMDPPVDSCDPDVPVATLTTMEQGRLKVKDGPETARLFSFLQILTAVFGAFAHGGNDVSNAIGPLISLWLIGSTGLISQKAATPMPILLYGGVGISLGLCILGRRVIKTLGEDLTKITPSSGFCIEIGSALTVLVASNIGIPISTTHCKVGSVVFVGRFRARENVDWSIFRNIVVAWLVTLPVAGGISAAIMAGLRLAVPE